MPRLLRLDSSADTATSRSRAMTSAFTDAWTAVGPDHTVIHRDLHAQPLPHLADAALHWPARLRPEGTRVPVDAEQLQEEILTELLSADAVVVGAPMYNYSLPSSLKAWVDHIHVPGRMAPFDTDTQPMAGRPAVVMTSRGASYDPGTPTADWDHAVPVLELILGTSLGMKVTTLVTSLTLAEAIPALADQVDRSRAEFALATEQAAALGAELGSLLAG